MNENGNAEAKKKALVERIENGLAMLARYRRQNDEARQGLIELIKQLEATLEYQHCSRTKAEAEREMVAAERMVREATLEYLDLTGEKPKVHGVGTRSKTTLAYDNNMALAWCQLFFEQALVLNRDLFEKHARAVAETNPVPFVEFHTEIIATIAQDLSEYIQDDVLEDGFPA